MRSLSAAGKLGKSGGVDEDGNPIAGGDGEGGTEGGDAAVTKKGSGFSIVALVLVAILAFLVGRILNT